MRTQLLSLDAVRRNQNEAPPSGMAKLYTGRGIGIPMYIESLRPEQRR